MKRGFFVFGDINSKDHNIYISAGGTFDMAEPEYETVQIPGRNGDILVKSDRFINIELSYPAFTFATNRAEFRRKMTDIRSALGSQSGYQRLWDSYNPEEYRLAIFKGGISTKPVAHVKAGEFDIEFECKPQRFLIEGEEEISLTAAGQIFNPTLFASKPLIVVSGTGTLGIGSYSVAVVGATGLDTYIDCDLMDAYTISGGVKTSRNGYVTTGTYFPELKPGANNIALGSGITKVVIIPRWWTL